MKKKTAFFWLIYTAAFALAIVTLRVQSTRASYLLSDSRNQIKIKQCRNKHLQLAINELKSPANIEAVAKSKLGMTVIEPDMVVMIDQQQNNQPSGKWLAKMFSSAGEAN